MLDTDLPELFAKTNKDTVPSLIERAMDLHTLTDANKYMAFTVVESDFFTSDYKPDRPLNFVIELPSSMDRWSAQ